MASEQVPEEAFEDVVKIFQRETSGQIPLWNAELQRINGLLNRAESPSSGSKPEKDLREARELVASLIQTIGRSTDAADRVKTILELRDKDVDIQTKVVAAYHDEFVSKMMLYGGGTLAGAATSVTVGAIELHVSSVLLYSYALLSAALAVVIPAFVTRASFEARRSVFFRRQLRLPPKDL